MKNFPGEGGFVNVDYVEDPITQTESGFTPPVDSLIPVKPTPKVKTSKAKVMKEKPIAKTKPVAKVKAESKTKKVVKTDNAFDGIEKAVVLVRALAPNTQNGRVSQRILGAVKPDIPVTKLYRQLRLPQSVTSASLAILRNLNLLKMKKVGRSRFYERNEQQIAKVKKALKEMV